MKNKKLLYIVSFIVLIILIIVLVLIMCNGGKKSKSIVVVGEYSNRLEVENGFVIKNYDEYSKYFDSDLVSKADFDDSNYVVVEADYDSCAESDLKVKDYYIEDDLLNVNITYTGSCGVCALNFMYFLIPVEKSIDSIEVNVEYKRTNELDCPQDIEYKPIIYLYPTVDTNVTVELGYPENITVSYPKYNNYWDVFAYTNGDLYDNKTGRYLYGLYWEGRNHFSEVSDTGFVVKGEDSLEFLEEKLAILGLTEREADEFIIYWLPKLESSPYNYIRFETIDEINSYMPLKVTPTPDTVIRVMMDYKPLNEKVNVEEENLVPISRNGFVVVEWGGSIIK